MNCNPLLAVWLSAIPLVAAPGVETFFQPVALTSQLAPGLSNNITFSSFDYVSLADDGRIAFTAQISGPGVTSTNNLGLWAGLPGDLRLLARTGELAPGVAQGERFRYFAAPNIDAHQVVGVVAQLTASSGDVSAQGEFFGRLLILNFGVFGFFPAALLLDPNEPIICNDVLGHVVNTVGVRAELSGAGIGLTNDLAIIAGPPTNVVIVARKGAPAPGVTGGFTFFPPSPLTLAIMPDGNVAFRATATDGPATREGIWFGKAGAVQAAMVAGKGPAPESLLGPGYTFGFGPSSANVEVNARGELAFATPLIGPGLNGTNSEFVIAGPPGSFRVVAQMGQPAPGIPGAFFGPFAAFSHVLLAADGTVAFTGRYSDTGWDFGLWLAPTNGVAPVLLMHTGQPAPGTPTGVVFTNSFPFLPPFEEAFMNARNQIVFRALVGGPGVASHYGIWLAEPDAPVRLIARSGDMLDIGGGVMKQISTATFGNDPETIASPEDGRRSPFNDRGEIALLLRFTDSSSGVFIARTGINLSAARVGTDIHVQFPTITGKQYRVDYRTNLTSSPWLPLTSAMPGTGAQLTVTNANALQSTSRYYRAVRMD